MHYQSGVEGRRDYMRHAIRMATRTHRLRFIYSVTFIIMIIRIIYIIPILSFNPVIGTPTVRPVTFRPIFFSFCNDWDEQQGHEMSCTEMNGHRVCIDIRAKDVGILGSVRLF